jgi:hypothetical protein
MKKNHCAKVSLEERIALLEAGSKEERLAKRADSQSVIQTVNTLASTKLEQIYRFQTADHKFKRDPWPEIFGSLEDFSVISVNAKTAEKEMNFAELGELLAIGHKAFDDVPVSDSCYVLLTHIMNFAMKD